MPQSLVRASLFSIACLIALAAPAANAAEADARAAPTLADPVLTNALSRDLDISPAQLPRLLRVQRHAGAEEARIRREFGEDFAGSWIERAPDGVSRLVVATSGRQRASVSCSELCGSVEVRQVRYRWSRLQASKQRLDEALKSRRIGIHKPLRGIHTWHVDPVSNRVVVRIARDAGPELADFIAASGADIDAMRLEYMDGVPQPTNWIYGGISYITASGGGCTSGFAAYKAAAPGVVTAGHCGTAPDRIDVDWSGIGRTYFGVFENSRFPGADRGWIRSSASYAVSAQIYDWNGGYIAVKGSAEAPIGATVCRAGPKTAYRCGQITAKQVTVNYPIGALYNMSEGNNCSGLGDSGGPWIDPLGQAQGIQSGNSGVSSAGHNCDMPASQRRSWFDPINPILSEFGLVLAVG
ncbi:hypothetical protein A7A76_06100 [Lysobacter enzymogenes]|uniref:S1 family peptidase n=1 Tax=Lysobacter enzymogenes TaxID=69 RepID=UPI0019D2E788|nr:S1 family peptidase [Lysobacter enzymogenes]MBN7138681.1 hypothetical protein [Lysobacter enzymogenes]